MSLHQQEIETLETLLTLVSERRMSASQSLEHWKRKVNDANNSHDRSTAGQAMDLHQFLELKYKSLAEEMEAVIEEQYGADWRTS